MTLAIAMVTETYPPEVNGVARTVKEMVEGLRARGYFVQLVRPRQNDTHPLAPGFQNVDRLIGLSRDGVPFEFAVNIYNESEFAGACFSPDGSILSINIQGSAAKRAGMTCAITGPWRRGPL